MGFMISMTLSSKLKQIEEQKYFFAYQCYSLFFFYCIFVYNLDLYQMRKVFSLLLLIVLISFQVECSLKVDVYKLLRKYFNRKATIGIMGNIHVETGGTYDYKTKQIKGNGYGLFQFDFLKSYYFAYIKKEKLTDSAQNQIKFVYETIYGTEKNLIGAGIANKLGAFLKDPKKTLRAVTQQFCTKYEKPGVPHLELRLAAAAKLDTDKTLQD